MKTVRHKPQSIESTMLGRASASQGVVPCSCLGISSTLVTVRGSILLSTAWSSKASYGGWPVACTIILSYISKLGMLSPSMDAIAKALAGRDRLRIQPSGAYAANLLHLSEQVPAKAVFLTDGPSCRLKVGASEIVLKRTTPRAMAAAGRISGLVIQGLKYLGQQHVTMERLAPLRKLLSEKDRAQLKQDISLAPAWMRPFLQAVAEGKKRP